MPDNQEGNQEKTRLLAERYEILRRTSQCGESVVYFGRDAQTGQSVTVREFFADALMLRTHNGEIKVRPGYEVQYKSLCSDYEELIRYLMGMGEEKALLRPYDVFRWNNTVYCAENLSSTQTLDDYLARHAGRISWPVLKKEIAPLAAVLGKLHAQGVYHRGISTQTVLVGEAENFMLTGLCIPAARTANSEIPATLYFGYSAPEQYSSNSWQGAWSDVYSLAAVCYRALTGITPVEWRQRGGSRALIPARTLEGTIPEHVSNALMSALSVDLRSRYRSVEEFWSAMLCGPGEATTTYRPPSAARMGSPVEQRRNPPRDPRRIIALAAAGVVLVLILSLVVSQVLIQVFIGPNEPASSSQLSESLSSEESETPQTSSQLPEESSQPPSSSESVALVVPNLVGSGVEAVMINPLYAQLFTFQLNIFIPKIAVGTVRPMIRSRELPAGQAHYHACQQGDGEGHDAQGGRRTGRARDTHAQCLGNSF
jgi:serine/threonine-protein kinase